MKKLKVKAKTKPSRKQMLLAEAKDAEIRASYHDYYGRKTPEYFVEMRLAHRLRELAG
jgi:hypothetical protein